MECLQKIYNWTASECINATWFSFISSLRQPAPQLIARQWNRNQWKGFSLDFPTHKVRRTWENPRIGRISAAVVLILSPRIFIVSSKRFFISPVLIFLDYNKFQMVFHCYKRPQHEEKGKLRSTPVESSQEVENNQTCLNILRPFESEALPINFSLRLSL